MTDKSFSELFRRICAHTPDVIWIGTDDVREIAYVNDAVESTFGLSPQELYRDSRARLDAVHAADRSELRGLFETLREQGTGGPEPEKHDLEYRVDTDGPEVRWMSEVVFPVTDSSGELLAWSGIVRDITRQRRREQTFEVQAEQLALLNQVVRHDIRNEVNLGLEMLRSAKRGGSVDADRLARIEEILHHVSDLTETARDMTEVITTLSEEVESVPLAPTVKREIANVSTMSNDAQFRIDGEIPKVDVRVNEILSAAFRNLLTNAIHHNDKPQPEVTVSATVSDGRAIVHIADNGPGIPDERKDMVFESGRTLRESGGTGFGLSLVETLLDQYGGNIYLHDNDPEGSVFTVVLPVADD